MRSAWRPGETVQALSRLARRRPLRTITGFFCVSLVGAGIALLAAGSADQPAPPPQLAHPLGEPGPQAPSSSVPGQAGSADSWRRAARGLLARRSVSTSSGATAARPSSASGSVATTKVSHSSAPVSRASNSAPQSPRPGGTTAGGSAAVPAGSMSIRIPAINVQAPMVSVGLNPDKSVQVPPLNKPYETGWYDGSAIPGQDGAAVILGHVDTAATGPAVFYNLGRMRPGDSIMIGLARREVVYRVDGVREYQKTALPADLIYGPLPYPGLRLITCGGQFDYQTGHYVDNIVVFASIAGA